MNVRNKGLVFERWCVLQLRHIFPKVATCRFVGNLWMDACKVDLSGTDGYNFQCKAQERLSPGYHEILAGMPHGKNINAVIHKKNRSGIIVALKLDDFLRLIGRQMMP